MKSQNRLNSLLNAINGFSYLIKEPNFTVHFLLIFASFGVSYILEFALIELIILILTAGILLIAESTNTCIEYLCDFIEPKYNQNIKIIKDISAAMVLLSGILFFIVNALLIYKHF